MALVPKVQLFKVNLGRWRPGEGDDSFPKAETLLKAPLYSDDSLKKVRDMLKQEPLRVDLHVESDHMHIETDNGEPRVSIF